MKRLHSLGSICQELGGQCVYLPPSKKWTLDDAKAFIKQHWPNETGNGLTVFKFQEGAMVETTALFGWLEVSQDNITEDDDSIQIKIPGSYIAYDYFNGEIRMCNDGTNAMSIVFNKDGGAYLN